VGAKTPFWTGDGLGRPYSMGVRFGSFLSELSEKAGTAQFLKWITLYAPIDETGADNLEQYVIEQKRALGCIPTEKKIIVEYFSDETGQTKAVVHSMFGGRVNGALAIVLEHELSKKLHCQVEASYNDDGVLIGIMGYEGFPQNIMAAIDIDRVEDTLIEELPQTPLFSMTFRYNAARALMMGTQRKGKRTQLWAQRLRAMEVMGVAEKYKDHPLIVETFRECMETVLDVPDLLEVLGGIASGKIQVLEKITSHPSPFTSELLFKFMGVMMYEGQMPNPRKPENKIVSSREALNLRYKGVYKNKDIDIKAV
jgi:ATP-dependent Lhr-like helicase